MDRHQIVKRLQELDLIEDRRKTNGKVPVSPELRLEGTRPPLVRPRTHDPPRVGYFARSLVDRSDVSFNRRDFLMKFNVDIRPKVFLGSETLLDATSPAGPRQTVLGNVTARDLATCKRMHLSAPLRKPQFARNNSYWRSHTAD